MLKSTAIYEAYDVYTFYFKHNSYLYTVIILLFCKHCPLCKWRPTSMIRRRRLLYLAVVFIYDRTILSNFLLHFVSLVSISKYFTGFRCWDTSNYLKCKSVSVMGWGAVTHVPMKCFRNRFGQIVPESNFNNFILFQIIINYVTVNIMMYVYLCSFFI